MNQYLVNNDGIFGLLKEFKNASITSLFSRYEEYFLFLGLNRSTTKPPDYLNYAKIYLALLKREQLIMFTFFSWNDYNLFYVKISRFLALLSFEMVMNSLFFADETIHKLYLEEGKYFNNLCLQIST